MSEAPVTTGRVYLVGAGPGDAGLVTLRGAECLRRADVVLYDYLVNPQILAHAPAGAARVSLGQHGKGRLWTQEEINERMVAEALAGRTVVRLKGGDPAVFGRLAEEAAALAAAGIPMEIVPGVTAGLAVASYAGIPLTHRQEASAVALVTGQQGEPQSDATASELDYRALAAFPGTLVFYMGVTTAGKWTARLIEAGKSPETPAAIVRRCTFPDQRTIFCRLGEVATRIAAERMRPPVVVVVGSVVAHSSALDWFGLRPLSGRRVLVTRPEEQAGELAERLSELGAEVLVQPAIAISDPPDWSSVDAALARLDQFHWLVFSSANGVRKLMGRLLALGGDARRLAGLRLAAMGPGSAEELARFHLKADAVPQEYRAESLAEQLVDRARRGEGRRFLLVRASRGREVLAEALRAAGAAVEQIVVYDSSDVTTPDPRVAELLKAGKIDWTTVTSSAIARSLAALLGEDLRRTRLASLSPITSATLRSLGFSVAAEASPHTMPALVEAITRQCGSGGASVPPS